MWVLIVMPPSTYTLRSLADWTGWTEPWPTCTFPLGMWWRRRAGAHQMNSCLLYVQLQPIAGCPTRDVDDALRHVGLERAGIRRWGPAVNLGVICVQMTVLWSAISGARSAVYSAKSRGPRTEPCGTPNLMYSCADCVPAWQTDCWRSVRLLRYELIQVSATPLMPYDSRRRRSRMQYRPIRNRCLGWIA